MVASTYAQLNATAAAMYHNNNYKITSRSCATRSMNNGGTGWIAAPICNANHTI